MTNTPVAWPIAWPIAWHDAHLGPQGFYRTNTPARHFATEAQEGPLVEALAIVIEQVAGRLPLADPIDIVDIGAGSGEMLTSLLAALRDESRFHFTAIDVRPRPIGLPDRIDWVVGVAPDILERIRPEGITGIILAHEWLDDLPVDVVARDDDGRIRQVLVDPSTGAESMGDTVLPDSAAQRWLDQWWGPVLDRAEIGWHRDAAWRAVCASLRTGLALAIDYGHTRGERDRFATGSIIGYRGGAAHWPIPDGSMNLTAHVTWDSLAAATDPPGVVRSQAEVLAELIAPAAPPDGALAESDPRLFTEQLQRYSQRARLLDRSAGVSWLRVDVSPPRSRGRNDHGAGESSRRMRTVMGVSPEDGLGVADL